jgi:hypothetical protein
MFTDFNPFSIKNKNGEIKKKLKISKKVGSKFNENND